MVLSGTHVSIVVYQAYQWTHLMLVLLGFHFYRSVYLLFIDQLTFQVTQKPRYTILVFSKKDYFILHLRKLYLSLCGVSSNLSGWWCQIYAWINSNPWKFLFVLSWEVSGGFLTSNVTRFTGTFPTVGWSYIRYLPPHHIW